MCLSKKQTTTPAAVYQGITTQEQPGKKPARTLTNALPAAVRTKARATMACLGITVCVNTGSGEKDVRSTSTNVGQ